ncbi:hypothetical protein Taro_029677 [Colocasia esculenta]|uniref:Uncharacterized protein n=1 Tax=Colocasia esculenta TaxID=4460 RepID=A0A843VVK4_COLES|nr:hypothetical protein [Colocasia esculenta]
MEVWTWVEDKISSLPSTSETSQQRQGALRAEETAVVMVPVASSGSPFSCTSPSGYAPKGLPSRVSGSVGGDRENWVLSLGRGSGSQGRYNIQLTTD